MNPARRRADLISAGVIVFTVAAFVPARAIFPLVESPRLADWLGDVLRIQFHIFLTVSGYLYMMIFHSVVFPVIFTILGALILFRFAQFLKAQRRFPPEFGISIAATAVAWQFILDVSPWLLLYCVLTGIWLGLYLKYPRLNNPASYLVPCLILVGMAPQGDWAEVTAAIIFGVGLILVAMAWPRFCGSAPVLVPVVFLLACCAQVIAAFLPEYRVSPFARKFTSVSSYSFCENTKSAVLFAAHPRCAFAMSGKSCQQGYVGIYDSDTLAPTDSVRIFGADSYGRIEQIVCAGENLYLGLNGVHVNSHELGPAAVAVESVLGSRHISVNFAGAGVGQSMVYDGTRHSLFLTAEFSNRIYRWDTQKLALQADLPSPPENPWYRPYSGLVHSGSLMTHGDAISRTANSAWFAEWINGRYIHEVDLDSHRLKRSIGFFGGAATAVMVDDEASAIWVPQVWGVCVYDLKTGAERARHRLGLMNRAPVVDGRHDLVFMTGTFSGRTYIFDRKSGRLLGKLAMGIGGRHLLYSGNTRRLYASSRAGSFYFDMSDDSAFIHWLQSLKETRH